MKPPLLLGTTVFFNKSPSDKLSLIELQDPLSVISCHPNGLNAVYFFKSLYLTKVLNKLNTFANSAFGFQVLSCLQRELFISKIFLVVEDCLNFFFFSVAVD